MSLSRTYCPYFRRDTGMFLNNIVPCYKLREAISGKLKTTSGHPVFIKRR